MSPRIPTPKILHLKKIPHPPPLLSVVHPFPGQFVTQHVQSFFSKYFICLLPTAKMCSKRTGTEEEAFLFLLILLIGGNQEK
jgi:hypothetical protein